jgi:hypothetical protein
VRRAIHDFALASQASAGQLAKAWAAERSTSGSDGCPGQG